MTLTGRWSSCDAEALALGYVQDRGLECRRYSKQEMRLGKTPDCRVFLDGRLVFFLEVKAVEDSQWAHGGRCDPVFNRLSDDIHVAVKQFDAVNPDHRTPNVLVFVNYDRVCSPSDLIETLTGMLTLEDGGHAPTCRHISEGRIRDEKMRVDVYAWFNAWARAERYFRYTTLAHLSEPWFHLLVRDTSDKPFPPVDLSM